MIGTAQLKGLRNGYQEFADSWHYRSSRETCTYDTVAPVDCMQAVDTVRYSHRFNLVIKIDTLQTVSDDGCGRCSIEQSDDSPSTLIVTGFYTTTTTVLHVYVFFNCQSVARTKSASLLTCTFRAAE